MKNLFLLLVLVITPMGAVAQEQAEAPVGHPDVLVGEWIIDLRPTPDSEGYFQPFVVESAEGGTLVGTFYGSPLEQALLNDNWDRLYFAFTTNDQSSAYYHSGYLSEGKLFGITYCPNRNFTAPWTGTKK